MNFPKISASIHHQKWLFSRFLGFTVNTEALYSRQGPHGSIGATHIEVLTPEGTGAQLDGCNPEQHLASSTTKIGQSSWFSGVRENNAASHCHPSTDQLIGATHIEVLAPEGTGVT